MEAACEKVELNVNVINPGAALKNHAAQRQLAAWLVRYGIEKGTIQHPLKRREVLSCEPEEKKVLCMRRRFDEEELCAAHG